jgi:hypothetical protein
LRPALMRAPASGAAGSSWCSRSTRWSKRTAGCASS